MSLSDSATRVRPSCIEQLQQFLQMNEINDITCAIKQNQPIPGALQGFFQQT
jgi:hypothetical protein